MAWLLHRLEMALPQPVVRGKAGEQVGAGLGGAGALSGGWRRLGSSGKGGMVPGWEGRAQKEEGSPQLELSPPSLPVCMAHTHSTHTVWSLWPQG